MANSAMRPDQAVAGGQRANAVNDCERILGRAEGQVVQKTGMIQAAGHEASPQNCANFGSKKKVRSRFRVVKRLDAHGIASEEQVMLACIPDSEGKHPAEFWQTLLTPARVGLQ